MEKKPQSESEEFRRFEELTRKLVSVPKKEIQDRKKKAAKSETKKHRS
jgi:hypothetical protein